MQHNIIMQDSYSNQIVEDAIVKTENKSLEYAKTKGKEDALATKEITELAFKVKAKDPIDGIIQEGRDTITKELQIEATITNIQEQEQNTICKNKEYARTVATLNLEISELEQEKNAIPIDHVTYRFGFLLLPVSIFMGLADAIMSYSSFRNSFPFLLSFIASLAIGVLISVSHFGYTKWVMKSPTKQMRRLKITTILFIATVFFFCIAIMRAKGLSSVVDTSINTPAVGPNSNSYLAAATIFFISITLFAIVFNLALTLWRSDTERKNQKKYRKISTDILQKNKQKLLLQQTIDSAEKTIIRQKAEARKKHRYHTYCIERVNNIGIHAITTYKNIYATYHDSIPAFFKDTITIEQKGSSHFYDLEK